MMGMGETSTNNWATEWLPAKSYVMLSQNYYQEDIPNTDTLYLALNQHEEEEE